MELCDECASLCAVWLKAVGRLVHAMQDSEPDETIAALERAAFVSFDHYDATGRKCGVFKYMYRDGEWRWSN